MTPHDLVVKLLKLFDPAFYQEIKELNFTTSTQLSSTNQNEKLKEILVAHQIL